MGPVTRGGNRKVLRDHQGITEYVQRRSGQHGFHFGFLFGLHTGFHSGIFHAKACGVLKVFLAHIVRAVVISTGFYDGFCRVSPAHLIYK